MVHLSSRDVHRPKKLGISWGLVKNSRHFYRLGAARRTLISMSDADFGLKHEAVDELKRLAAHPVQEVERLERTALEGSTAASIDHRRRDLHRRPRDRSCDVRLRRARDLARRGVTARAEHADLALAADHPALLCALEEAAGGGAARVLRAAPHSSAAAGARATRGHFRGRGGHEPQHEVKQHAELALVVGKERLTQPVGSAFRRVTSSGFGGGGGEIHPPSAAAMLGRPRPQPSSSTRCP